MKKRKDALQNERKLVLSFDSMHETAACCLSRLQSVHEDACRLG